MKSESPDPNTVIAFDDAKRPHLFARKEERLAAVKAGFEAYLSGGGAETRQQRRKKQRDAKKRKGR